MRQVTISYLDDGRIEIEDSDEQYVDIGYDGDKAYFLSQLFGDDRPVTGSCDAAIAMTEALRLMGVLD